MDLKRVERQRSELLLLVILLLMIFLGAIAYISFQQEQVLVPALTIISLLACLYIIDKERRLKNLQQQLIKELIEEQHRSTSLESRLKEITGLYRAISTVNSVLEPEDTFDTVLRAALELVGGNRGSVMLIDDRDSRLKIVAAHGLTDAVVAQTRQRIGKGVAGWVAQHCEPVLLSGDVKDDDRFEDPLGEEDLHFSISVPLHLRDEVLGVLNLGLTPGASRGEFSEYDLRMTTVFAQHASVAIENARLRLTESITGSAQ